MYFDYFYSLLLLLDQVIKKPILRAKYGLGEIKHLLDSSNWLICHLVDSCIWLPAVPGAVWDFKGSVWHGGAG
jgi:hypothetical protein